MWMLKITRVRLTNENIWLKTRGMEAFCTQHHIILAEMFVIVVWKVYSRWTVLFALDSKQSVAWLPHVLFNKIQKEKHVLWGKWKQKSTTGWFGEFVTYQFANDTKMIYPPERKEPNFLRQSSDCSSCCRRALLPPQQKPEMRHLAKMCKGQFFY